MTELKPTAPRVALAHGIAKHEVRHYPWKPPDKPFTIWRTNGGLGEKLVTANVAQFVAAGLAAHAEPSLDFGYARVELTEAGWAWLDRHGGGDR
jgi:hypothetical protein